MSETTQPTTTTVDTTTDVSAPMPKVDLDSYEVPTDLLTAPSSPNLTFSASVLPETTPSQIRLPAQIPTMPRTIDYGNIPKAQALSSRFDLASQGINLKAFNQVTASMASSGLSPNMSSIYKGGEGISYTASDFINQGLTEVLVPGGVFADLSAENKSLVSGTTTTLLGNMQDSPGYDASLTIGDTYTSLVNSMTDKHLSAGREHVYKNWPKGVENVVYFGASSANKFGPEIKRVDLPAVIEMTDAAEVEQAKVDALPAEVRDLPLVRRIQANLDAVHALKGKPGFSTKAPEKVNYRNIAMAPLGEYVDKRGNPLSADDKSKVLGTLYENLEYQQAIKDLSDSDGDIERFKEITRSLIPAAAAKTVVKPTILGDRMADGSFDKDGTNILSLGVLSLTLYGQTIGEDKRFERQREASREDAKYAQQLQQQNAQFAHDLREETRTSTRTPGSASANLTLGA